MTTLKDKTAVVTGASSGIGKAIAGKLAKGGTRLHLVGRDMERLEAAVKSFPQPRNKVQCHQADLSDDDDLGQFVKTLKVKATSIDVLIHSAGVISLGSIESAPVEELDEQYRVNLRAPFVLTQALLPMIARPGGQIVFINSSVGLQARGNIGLYAATKHGLKALADSLRDEVNPEGIRVLSIYPGRTATPMQAAIYETEGWTYKPDALMQPEEVAEVVVNALGLPMTAEVTDIRIRPMNKTA